LRAWRKPLICILFFRGAVHRKTKVYCHPCPQGVPVKLVRLDNESDSSSDATARFSNFTLNVLPNSSMLTYALPPPHSELITEAFFPFSSARFRHVSVTPSFSTRNASAGIGSFGMPASPFACDMLCRGNQKLRSQELGKLGQAHAVAVLLPIPTAERLIVQNVTVGNAALS
jgi:hypothetical protein